MINTTHKKSLMTAGMATVILTLAATATPVFAVGGEERAIELSDAQAGIHGTKEVQLVSVSSPNMYTVCADSLGYGDIDVKYEGKEIVVSPGHCVNIEAASMSAMGVAETTHGAVHVFHRDLGEAARTQP